MDLTNPRNPKHDIGVYVLESAPSVATEPFYALRAQPVVVAASTTWIGYGVTGVNQSDAGRKRAVELEVETVGGEWLFASSENGQSVCMGDSGGPVFSISAEGVREQAGVIVSTDFECSVGGVAARIDTNAAFIREQIDSAEGLGGCDASVGHARSTLFLMLMTAMLLSRRRRPSPRTKEL
jgi:hypothetical protein